MFIEIISLTKPAPVSSQILKTNSSSSQDVNYLAHLEIIISLILFFKSKNKSQKKKIQKILFSAFKSCDCRLCVCCVRHFLRIFFNVLLFLFTKVKSPNNQFKTLFSYLFLNCNLFIKMKKREKMVYNPHQSRYLLSPVCRIYCWWNPDYYWNPRLWLLIPDLHVNHIHWRQRFILFRIYVLLPAEFYWNHRFWRIFVVVVEITLVSHLF